MSSRSIALLIADDSGQDLIEYAVTSGAVTAGTAIFCVLFTLYLRFVFFGIAVNPGDGVQAVWEPCPPGGCS